MCLCILIFFYSLTLSFAILHRVYCWLLTVYFYVWVSGNQNETKKEHYQRLEAIRRVVGIYSLEEKMSMFYMNSCVMSEKCVTTAIGKKFNHTRDGTCGC